LEIVSIPICHRTTGKGQNYSVTQLILYVRLSDLKCKIALVVDGRAVDYFDDIKEAMKAYGLLFS
jgi:hypothetical protein